MSAKDNVTLVMIETFYHDLARKSLEETLKRVPFKNVVVFSDQNILPGSTWVPIQPTTTMFDYCDLLLKGMWPYIGTSHMIFQQWDAMIWNPDAWTDDFLLFDYIGAVWPWQPPTNAVGNGGFSLRSRKLIQALRHPGIQMIPTGPHGIQEDNYIAIVHRQMLEQQFGIRFAGIELAKQFSHELADGGDNSMAFHGLWNVVRFMPSDVGYYFIENAPDNTWNEVHRSHHIIVEIGRRGWTPLIEKQKAKIQAGTAFPDLMRWLHNEEFAEKSTIMRLLLS